MPSSLENYGAFAVHEDPGPHADAYQAKADELGRVDGKVNNALKSKGVFVVGLFGIVGTIAAVGYMPKIMPSSELADLQAVSGSCAHQVGCAVHNDYCSQYDSTKLSCASPMDGYDYLGDVVRQCTEQSGCDVSSTKCSDKAPGSLECIKALDGFYTFEGVVGTCPDVANAAPTVKCMPPSYTTQQCEEFHLGFTLIVDGVTQAVMEFPNVGDKIDAVLKANLPPTVEEVHWEHMEIIGDDDAGGDYSYSYADSRKLVGRACETDAGESCAMYLFDNLIDGTTVAQKCGVIDNFMQEGPPDAKLASWGNLMADQGCGVGLPDFGETCLEPAIRYRCEKVFNGFEEETPNERRLSAGVFKGLPKPDHPRRLQDVPPTHIVGSVSMAFDIRVTYDFCDTATITAPDILGQTIAQLMNDIEVSEPQWVATVEAETNTFTGANMDFNIEKNSYTNMGTTPKAKQTLVPPVPVYDCLPAYEKTFPTCTACTSQAACAMDFPPPMCSTTPGFVDKLCCEIAQDGSYVEAGCLTKTCKPVPNCAVGVTCTSGDSSVCLDCPNDHYHVDNGAGHDMCLPCKKQSCCDVQGTIGAVCLTDPGQTVGAAGTLESLTEYLTCSDPVDGFFIKDDICHVCPTGDHVGAVTCRLADAQCPSPGTLVSKFTACKAGWKYYHVTGECDSDMCTECVEQAHCMLGQSTATCTGQTEAKLMCMNADKGWYTQAGIVHACPSVDNVVPTKYSCYFDPVDNSVKTTVEECLPGYHIGPNSDTCEPCATQSYCGTHKQECFVDTDGLHKLVCEAPTSACDIYISPVGKAGMCFPVSDSKCTSCTGPLDTELTSVTCNNMYFEDQLTCSSCMGSIYSPNVATFKDVEGACEIDTCHSGYEEPAPAGDPSAGTCYTLTMQDSYGDGWNGNHWHWVDASGSDTTGTLASGSSGTAPLCSTGVSCHTFYVDDSGGWPYEVSWTVTDPAGSTIASGHADNAQHQICPPAPGGAAAPGGCVNIDYCTTSVCAGVQTCTDASPPKDGSTETDHFFCHCPAGKSGATAVNGPASCVEVDNCATASCGPMAVCSDHPYDSNYGSDAYECSCDTGAQGAIAINAAATCTDVDGCSSMSCGADSFCTDHPFPATGASCQCNPGYVNTYPTDPFNYDAQANAAVSCVETTLQTGCEVGTSGVYAVDADIEFKPCTDPMDGYYLDGDKAVVCPIMPPEMIASTVVCDGPTGGLVAPMGKCATGYYPGDTVVATCTACTVQAGCETSFAYCSIDKPTELACQKPFDDFILSETDIVEPATRRLRGE